MFGDIYASLLAELSTALESPVRFEPDENNACVIEFPSGVAVQLELDAQKNNLVIFANLGALASGKYREEVLYESLRANDAPVPRYGNFAYLAARNQLLLWEVLPLKNLRGQDVARQLIPFAAKAAECQQAIASNTLPAIPMAAAKTTSPMGIFGRR